VLEVVDEFLEDRAARDVVLEEELLDSHEACHFLVALLFTIRNIMTNQLFSAFIKEEHGMPNPLHFSQNIVRANLLNFLVKHDLLPFHKALAHPALQITMLEKNIDGQPAPVRDCPILSHS